MRLWSLAILASVATVALVSSSPDQADARKATATERGAIVDALERRLGIDESNACKRAWIIRVAQSKPRLAAVAGHNRLRARHGCQVGDGYVIMRRPTARSQRWRVLFMSSGAAPSCVLTPPRVSRQLGFGGECSGRR